MKLTKAKMNELISHAIVLGGRGEYEAIQGMKDTVSILFKDTDENAAGFKKEAGYLLEGTKWEEM